MVEYIPQMSSLTFARRLESRKRLLYNNPKKNIVVEIKNKFIIEFSQAMLHDQNLLKFLWGGATNTMFYVQNRVPH